MLQQKLSEYPLGKSVRNGRCDTCPKTLTQFLTTCEGVSQRMPPEQARQVQVDALEILLETICDCMIAKCWRGWCLDNAHRPLRNIRLLSSTEAEKAHLVKLEAEMRTLSYYFLN
jgi:hypothetical protein